MTDWEGHYDVIIVGAGSAGCVLASRLSEEPSRSVLLVEAGGSDDDESVRMPAAFSRLFQTERDWNFFTVPQSELNNRSLYWPRGKMLGGSSSINAMIYIRGHRNDYDGWAELGCPGWSYDDLLPYFQRSEDNMRGADSFHGSGGPLRVEDQRWVSPTTRAWTEAAVAAGYKHNEDFNGAEQEGVGQYQLTCRSGQRWSAARAYLDRAMSRPNLMVITDALVERVILDPAASGGPRAVGLAVRRHGVRLSYEARQRVILSAGAIGSPQLLMLSGIGPGAHLRSVDIEPVADLIGVGENLSDHPAVPVIWSTRGVKSLQQEETAGNYVRWMLRHDGPLSSNVADSGGFFRTRDSMSAPDIQFHCAGAMFLRHGLSEVPGPGFSAGPTLVAPASRGTIRLATSDPRHRPLIDPKYFTAASDLESMVSGIEIARDIAELSPLRSLLGPEFLPGAFSRTREDLRRHVRATAETLYHPVGTAAMGTGDRAVVDPATLAVRGVQGLAVCDASLMPSVPRGNTNAPTIAIAERGAEILAD